MDAFDNAISLGVCPNVKELVTYGTNVIVEAPQHILNTEYGCATGRKIIENRAVSAWWPS